MARDKRTSPQDKPSQVTAPQATASPDVAPQDAPSQEGGSQDSAAQAIAPHHPGPLPGVNPPLGEDESDLTHPLPFTVVGIGASAGGLDAVSQVLRALTFDTGMAFFVVQHLDPRHESMLPEILARATPLAVAASTDQGAIEPGHVYVIPPGKNLVIGDCRQHLSPRTEERGQHRPIDIFFRSLAEHQGNRCIGVILSGSSSDGTLGLEEIKAAGGITFAQDDTAEHTIMPHSAIAAGCIDFVLPPHDIAHEIERISRHPYVAPNAEAAALLARNETAIGRVLDILRRGSGVDFANYKRNTLHRRITRRMLLHKFENLPDYVRHLEEAPAEAEALYQDILINVTSFFRDAEAYEALKDTVFPRLTEHKSRQDAVRVWALGCSTGEEAYSLAMAYTEYAESSGRRVPLQIFATDLNGIGIERARAGIYSKGIAQDLSPERLRRFFVEIDGSYRISKPIRDMCVFARQNVLADPPFSRMDLIACRNLLIYLEPVLQHKLLPLLHYALQPGGYLWLGSSETIGGFRDLFEIEDPKNKIYSRKPGGSAHVGIPPVPHRLTLPPLPHPVRGMEFPPNGPADPQREADRILLQRYAPAGVVVNAGLEIQQFRGDTSAYLSPAPGRASLGLLKMLREGLTVGVRGAVQQALRDGTVVRREGLRVKTRTGFDPVLVTVIPMSRGAHDSYLLITFEPMLPPVPGAAASGDAATAPGDVVGEADGGTSEVARLRHELDATREYLQSMIEQQEAVNEELQSANEEVQSTNEELQSINEELETSKEEIQSSNEELVTVNDELQKRNQELAQSNNDLLNLLNSVQMAIVMLDHDLRIRRFTPAAEKMLNLIAADIGRPIADIRLGLTGIDLQQVLDEALGGACVREHLVQDRTGAWHLLRAHPYRTHEKGVEGVVLLLVDIDRLHRTEFALGESEKRFALLAESAPVLIWFAGPDGRRHVNKAFREFFGLHSAELENADWTALLHPDDVERYLANYRQRIARRKPFEGEHRFRRADGVYRWLKTIAVPRGDGTEFAGYIGSKIDITDLKEAETALRNADRSKNNFLAMLAHELRTPLAALRNAVHVIGHNDSDAALTARAKSVIDRQTAQMVRMVDDLLDLSRLSRGTLQLRRQRIDLMEALRNAIDATAHARESNAQALHLEAPEQAIVVDADAARLQQVFANVLGNAARYTPPHGNVWVTVELEPAADGAQDGGARTVRVRVRDDGIGIEPDLLGHVFELFSQSTNASGAGTGLGLGLNLARRLIELHGGRIEAHSDGKDKGSEFVVCLAAEAPLVPIAAAAAANAPAAPLVGTPLRVLVVDDNADAADMLVYLLELAGQNVRSVNDGAAALHVAAEFRPQLVLLDVSMPDMDGREVARRLRADVALRDTCIVAVTGFSPSDAALDMSPDGFDARVTKPLEHEALLALVARVQKYGR